MYTLPASQLSEKLSCARKYGAIIFTPKQVGTALKIRLCLSGSSSKILARAAGVNESSLSRALAGKPSKKIASYLGFVKVAQ